MNKLDAGTDRTAAIAGKTVRRYTVGYVPNGGKGQPSPALNLGGKWLAESGFAIGQTVSVTVSQGRLMIEILT